MRDLPLLPPFEYPRLSVLADLTTAELNLRFTGRADIGATRRFDDYLVAVHVEAVERRVISVAVDFRALESVCSSCFKSLVSWLSRVQDLPPFRRYQIVFRVNREHRWQRRSFDALRCFAADVVSVEP